ncbi:MAG TPA: PhoU domain-containing protein [Acidimicrobiales bacterium]|nr:PhoU domain-containing protein [Acidimicrobiales bacterium]
MSTDSAPIHIRSAFQADLDQLRIQVELMGVRVDQNLELMRNALSSGDAELMDRAFAADDEIDAMHLSLLGRCYDLLNREQPMASDLRYVVSVVRILSEFERVGDLALRVIKLTPQVDELSRCGTPWDLAVTMVESAVEQYRMALRAWSTQDLELATRLVENRPPAESYTYHERLLAELQRLQGPDSAATAMGVYIIGQAADRIADHAAIIGARLRYLLTGEPAHLAAEVR